MGKGYKRRKENEPLDALYDKAVEDASELRCDYCPWCRIDALEKEQAAWRKFTNEANRTLDAADKKIAEQQQTIDRKDERIAELEAKLERLI